jgi:hypothetical protein
MFCLSLSLAFAITLSLVRQASAMVGSAASPHSHRVHHARPRVSAVHEAVTGGTAKQSAPVVARPAVHPFVRDDSDGLSRDPEDRNMGCLDSSP